MKHILYIAFLFFLILVTTSCDSAQTKNTEVEKELEGTYFNFDEIFYYGSTISRDVEHLFIKKNLTTVDSVYIDAYFNGRPNSINDTSFIEKLTTIEYNKYDVDEKYFNQIRNIFKTKDNNLTVSSCIAVFRDILISDKADFETFYRAILEAYAFTSDQMASFYMSNDNWDKGFEISLFDMSFGEDPDQILPGVMNASVIVKFIQESDQKIILVHDFLRMWIFLIELIAYEKEAPESPIMALAIGNAPQESTKSMLDENLFGPENQIADTDEEEDEFGFQDFDDDYADDDLND
jgi:hypothetical protein